MATNNTDSIFSNNPHNTCYKVWGEIVDIVEGGTFLITLVWGGQSYAITPRDPQTGALDHLRARTLDKVRGPGQGWNTERDARELAARLAR